MLGLKLIQVNKRGPWCCQYMVTKFASWQLLCFLYVLNNIDKLSYLYALTSSADYANWTNSQIPESTCSISHNAPFRTEMCIFLFWMEHYGIWNRYILELVKLFYSLITCIWYTVVMFDHRRLGTSNQMTHMYLDTFKCCYHLVLP